jgi:transposase
MKQEDVAQQVQVNRPVVVHWEKRFRTAGIGGLQEGKRSGRKPTIDPQIKAEIIAEATRPPPHLTRWSTQKMAKAKRVSPGTVHKLWKANDIKPHLKRTFKLSTDKAFEPKFWDVIGLYLNPPDRALVLCCDEKSQCQALERTQPGLPLGMGHVCTQTHDYVRHGTVTLFAALNYLSGKVHQCTAPNHTHKEWLKFLKQLDKETEEGLTLHLIVDNYATHKHEAVVSWVKWRNQRHKAKCGVERMVMHFTPTSSSWMNMVERFFRDLTVDCVRDGSFESVKELTDAIERYIVAHNLEPKRYVWRADGAEILAKINRAKLALEAINNNV